MHIFKAARDEIEDVVCIALSTIALKACNDNVPRQDEYHVQINKITKVLAKHGLIGARAPLKENSALFDGIEEKIKSGEVT